MSDLRLTPLGTSPAWYNPGEAMSGYLLTTGGFRVLVDCGSGVIARYLQDGLDAPSIDAIVITHMHADHMFDLVPLVYGLQYGGLEHWGTPQLWLPPGGADRFRTLVSSWGQDERFFEDAFDLHEYVPGTVFGIGPFRCDSIEVPHYIESFALRFEHESGIFVYSSDLGPLADIAAFAHGADLFLCEATLLEAGEEPDESRGHITAAEAGELARRAAARSLLLTHVPSALDEQEVVRQARRAYGAGAVEIAQSLTSYSITRPLARVS